MSVCGVLNTQAFFGIIGSMIVADEASEIVGVPLSATASINARELGVVVELMIASSFSSSVRRLMLTTAALGSLASSSTMYSTVCPAFVFGRSGTVCF